MDAFNQPEKPARGSGQQGEVTPGTEKLRPSRQKLPSGRRAYRACEALTEWLLYFMVIFNPWAFGTTQPWSIWVMNATGYGLGLLLVAKWLIRWRTGFLPSRWNQAPFLQENETKPDNHRTWITKLLAGLSVLLLAYCLLDAVNARRTYDYSNHTLTYFDHYISWLPHSYDQASSWALFWEYLGLALTFWAMRDWLLGKSSRERRADHKQPIDLSITRAPAILLPLQPHLFPDRLRRLLWVLCLNGAVLAVECIIQRQSQTAKLLGVMSTRFHPSAENQFGPYAYRGNAAQYFNLLWPVCLGFWWTLRQEAKHAQQFGARVGSSAHVLLLPCMVLMAASPVVSTSRGGAMIALGSLIGAMVLLLITDRHGHWLARLGLFLVCLAIIGLAVILGWEPLMKRFHHVFSDGMSGRDEIYQNARQMAKDFPLYGSGPGTFCTLYGEYRKEGFNKIWAAYAHDDWLETRITFGWVGFCLIILSLFSVLWHWRGGAGFASPWAFAAMVWLALTGCLAHAKFDFPMQIHSVLSLFLIHCSILCCLVRQPPKDWLRRLTL